MRTSVANIRALVREALLKESFAAGDLVMMADDEVPGIKFEPGDDGHGASFNLPRLSRGSGQEIIVQALGPPQRTDWGIKVPVKGYQGVFFVDPGSLSRAPAGAQGPRDSVDATWWARHREEMEDAGRLKVLGVKRGTGRYKTTHWELWDAPEEHKTEDAVMGAFRQMSKDWPIWSAKAVRDPDAGKWYVNYELDTSD
ncbi:hypothetical protein HN588_02285 [Candidatus Bathyarchaeota archaeon]|nr:hypothetical protein [Candidatus Bathyarchaeota archaeon]